MNDTTRHLVGLADWADRLSSPQNWAPDRESLHDDPDKFVSDHPDDAKNPDFDNIVADLHTAVAPFDDDTARCAALKALSWAATRRAGDMMLGQ